ncbi:MAG: ribosome maturation factor RimM [Bacteroidota bacterium]
MTKEECFNLGYISRRVGNHGDLAFVLDVDDSSRYKKLESVFIEINNSLIPFFIKKIAVSGSFCTVSLDGIDTLERADELVKSGLYLPLSFLPPLTGKKFYYHEMPGYLAIDKTYGELGIVKGILDFPNQAVFQIIKDKNEILVPVKDDFIVKIDRTQRILSLDAPEGLIDIYINKSADTDSEKETDDEAKD